MHLKQNKSWSEVHSNVDLKWRKKLTDGKDHMSCSLLSYACVWSKSCAEDNLLRWAGQLHQLVSSHVSCSKRFLRSRKCKDVKEVVGTRLNGKIWNCSHSCKLTTVYWDTNVPIPVLTVKKIFACENLSLNMRLVGYQWSWPVYCLYMSVFAYLFIFVLCCKFVHILISLCMALCCLIHMLNMDV